MHGADGQRAAMAVEDSAYGSILDRFMRGAERLRQTRISCHVSIHDTLVIHHTLHSGPLGTILRWLSLCVHNDSHGGEDGKERIEQGWLHGSEDTIVVVWMHLHLLIWPLERTRSIHQGMVFSFMSRKHRPVERTSPTNLHPNRVQRANHRVPWRSPSKEWDLCGQGRTSGCHCQCRGLARSVWPQEQSPLCIRSRLVSSQSNPDDQSWS